MRVTLGGLTRSSAASWPSVRGPLRSMVTSAEMREGLSPATVWLRSCRARRMMTSRR